MAGQNQLNRIREAFQIPDSVIITALTPFNPLKTPIKHSDPKFQIPQTNNADKELYKSSLGTPVYADIEFLAGRYETNTKGVFKEFGSLKFDAVLITVSQAKKIIKTEIQGRDGTVKEYIGMDDYQVQVNGVISGTNGHRPIDEINALKKMLDAPIPIGVASTYLQNLDINLLVVGSYELAEQAGGYSYQTFSITFVSDVPQELRLINV